MCVCVLFRPMDHCYVSSRVYTVFFLQCREFLNARIASRWKVVGTKRQ